MIKKGVVMVLIIIMVAINASQIKAQEQDFTHIIINSEDWRDVYSATMYGNLIGVGSDFLVSSRHGPVLLGGISKTNDIRIISSRNSPFVIGYQGVVRDSGFASADEVVLASPNQDLIEELDDITNFVIIGNTYGYDSIAVAPYAMINRAWVFFADRTNIDEIDSILSNREVDEVLIYGFVDRDVRDTLQKYGPKVINTGDRFEDNIEIVEEYLKIKPVKQVILSNGEFVETEILSGANPVLFTGKANVPDQISNYIKSSDFEVGVLVGADLVGSATNIRRSTGMSVIVKFARGARAPTGAVAAVEGLDLFYLPIPIVSLKLHSAKYNSATSQLEVTYKSDSNVPIFFRGTLTPISGTTELTRIGDVEPVFIAPNDFKQSHTQT